MEVKPDTIHITASNREEIDATHADLFVAVRGSSVVSGTEAMKKAKEVNALVEELTRNGVSAEQIHLQGVHVETASGVLLKSSSAIYRLRVRVTKLENLPALLDILSAQKNAAIEQIAWKYDERSARERGLDSALEAARTKAERVAKSLGVRIEGVYSFNENIYDEETPLRFAAQSAPMKRQSPSPEPSLEMDIHHSKTVQVNVEIEYRVGAIH